jgi:ABC-type Fe3+ transport system permease subunit
VCLPIGWLVAYAFSNRAGEATLANFRSLIDDPTLFEPLVTTFGLSFCVAVVAAIAAAPMAWIVARTDMPGRRVVRLLMTASFVTPPFLGAIAWEILAAPNSGILNKIWRDLTGAEDALFDVYSFPGLVFVISCYTAPYVFVVLSNALDRIPADLEDAAGILGAGRWKVVVGVTLPLALPALLAGTLVAFLQAMTLFGSPAILAIPAGFHTVTTKIYSLFQFPPRPQVASAAAIPLLTVTITLLWLQAKVLGRRGYAVLGGKNGEPRLVALGAWRWPVLVLTLFVLCLPLFFPYAALLKAAVSRVPSGPFDPANLTVENFTFVFFEFSQTRRAFSNTFVLAVATATGGTLLALLVASLAARRGGLLGRALEFLATAPIAIPGIVLGGRLPADARGFPRPASGTGGGVPHPRRGQARDAAAHHRPAAQERRHRGLVPHLHRCGARAFGGRDAVLVRHQGPFGRDLRPQRKRQSRRDRGHRRGDADRHLRGRRFRELDFRSGRGTAPAHGLTQDGEWKWLNSRGAWRSSPGRGAISAAQSRWNWRRRGQASSSTRARTGRRPRPSRPKSARTRWWRWPT